jgi:2-deoxy-D-gluconate 3-dehydrogenase
VAYAAAKHGVQGIVSDRPPSTARAKWQVLTPPQIKSFSNGWASKGVCVNAIAPGYISTDVSAVCTNPVPVPHPTLPTPASQLKSQC